MSLNVAGGLHINDIFGPDFEPQGLLQSGVKRLGERRLCRLVRVFPVTLAEANVHRVVELLRGGDAFPIPSGCTTNALADPDRPDLQVIFVTFRGDDGLARDSFRTAHNVLGVLSFETSEWPALEIFAAV